MKYAIGFREHYKMGLVPQYPDGYSKSVIDEWIDDQRIIFQKENNGNFTVACIDQEPDEHGYFIYSFMRFFVLGETTHCSVDFQSDNIMQLIEMLTIKLQSENE